VRTGTSGDARHCYEGIVLLQNAKCKIYMKKWLAPTLTTKTEGKKQKAVVCVYESMKECALTQFSISTHSERESKKGKKKPHWRTK
jgi:hypothetical protein